MESRSTPRDLPQLLLNGTLRPDCRLNFKDVPSAALNDETSNAEENASVPLRPKIKPVFFFKPAQTGRPHPRPIKPIHKTEKQANRFLGTLPPRPQSSKTPYSTQISPDMLLICHRPWGRMKKFSEPETVFSFSAKRPGLNEDQIV